MPKVADTTFTEDPATEDPTMALRRMRPTPILPFVHSPYMPRSSVRCPAPVLGGFFCGERQA